MATYMLTHLGERVFEFDLSAGQDNTDLLSAINFNLVSSLSDLTRYKNTADLSTWHDDDDDNADDDDEAYDDENGIGIMETNQGHRQEVLRSFGFHLLCLCSPWKWNV